MKLTKATIVKLEPRASRYIAFDDVVSGFGVRVEPSGSRSFVLEYRPSGQGRAAAKRRLTLGNVDSLPLDAARKSAADTLARIRLGADPMAERRQAKAEATMASVAADFMTQHVRAKLKPRSADEYGRLLDKLIVPMLGKMKLRDVKRRDVARLHGKLSLSGKTQANKAVAVISSMWEWAVLLDHVTTEANPARGIMRNREQGRERFLTDEELTRLGETLRLAETTGLPWRVNQGGKSTSKHLAKVDSRFTRVSPFATAAIRLLILTGARLREILHLKWEQIDFQRGMAFLADSKTGAKPLILSGAALQLLQALPREAGNPHVIPGEGADARSDLKRPWGAIVRHAGLNGLRIHDLRHSSASIMAGAGAPLQVIGKVLGHSQIATTQRYSHLSNDPVRQVADRLGAHVTAAMGDAAADGAEIVPLKPRAWA